MSFAGRLSLLLDVHIVIVIVNLLSLNNKGRRGRGLIDLYHSLSYLKRIRVDCLVRINARRVLTRTELQLRWLTHDIDLRNVALWFRISQYVVQVS